MGDTRRWRSMTMGLVLLSWGLMACAVEGGIINYGDSPLLPPGVRFLQVTESSATDDVPLYGPPDYFSVGMDFDPTNFVAAGTNGPADITNGQLNFGVKGNTTPLLVAIDQISLFEAGDYTLVGVGTSATQVLAGAIMRVTVTEIDGVPRAPLNLTPVNASVGFNLAANPGVVQPWSLGLSMNIDAQLAGMGIPFVAGATEIEVVIDDELLALSETSSIASIAKKDFRIDVVTEVIPEPAALTWAGLALCGLSRRRR